MSIKKLAGLLGAFGIMAGLIGAGVGAQFTGQVSAQENLNVGSFGCIVSTTTPNATVIKTNTDFDTVWYDVPELQSSALGSAAMSFTVTSTGDIPVVLTISEASILPTAAFTDLFTNPGPQTLTPGAATDSYTYNGGISWTELGNGDLGKSAAVAYAVSCNEKAATGGPVQPVTTMSFSAVSNGGRGLGSITDTFKGTNFIPNANLTIFMQRMGSPFPFDVNSLGAHSVLGDGTFNIQYPDNCAASPTGTGPALSYDMPVVVWASDGTRSAIGAGTIPCSKY